MRPQRPTVVFVSIINSLAIDSSANPHLNDAPGAIITFQGETLGLVPHFDLY
jgi:hypothetical protein